MIPIKNILAFTFTFILLSSRVVNYSSFTAAFVVTPSKKTTLAFPFVKTTDASTKNVNPFCTSNEPLRANLLSPADDSSDPSKTSCESQEDCSRRDEYCDMRSKMCERKKSVNAECDENYECLSGVCGEVRNINMIINEKVCVAR